MWHVKSQWTKEARRGVQKSYDGKEENEVWIKRERNQKVLGEESAKERQTTKDGARVEGCGAREGRRGCKQGREEGK